MFELISRVFGLGQDLRYALDGASVGRLGIRNRASERHSDKT